MWRNYMYTRRMQHKLSKMGRYCIFLEQTKSLVIILYLLTKILQQ